MKKNIFLLLLPFVVFALTSCSPSLGVEDITTELREFYVVAPNNVTRVSLDQDQSGLVIWDQDDYVSIFAGTTEQSKYQVKEGCSGKAETILIPCEPSNSFPNQSSNAGLEYLC